MIRAADPRRARLIQAQLCAGGMSATALSGAAFLRPSPQAEEVVLLDCVGHDVVGAADLLRSQATGPLAIIGWADVAAHIDAASALDGCAPADVHGVSLARYLRAAARFGVARAAADIRRGAPAPPAAPEEGLRLLYVGAPDPSFLYLDRMCRDRGAELCAVLTAFAAFDALHDSTFDAAILNGTSDPASALSLCAALRRNAELHDLPIALAGPARNGFESEAAGRGASLLLRRSHDSDLEWLAQHVRLARAHAQIRTSLRVLRDAAREARTQLVHAGYFEADLARQASAHQHANRPFSSIAFRLDGFAGLSPPDAARAFGEAASLALRLVRAEDLAGRIGEDTFAILLPNSDAHAADVASRRIAAVAECTAFAASPAGASVQLVSAIACLAPGEGGPGLLARTLDGLTPQQRRAQP
ncbi:MAG: GGDEF domain-containing protein [Caulobacterales bacterium]